MEAVHIRRLALAGAVFSLPFPTPGPFCLGTVRIVVVALAYLHEQLAFQMQERYQRLLKMRWPLSVGEVSRVGVVNSGQGLKV